LNILMQRFKDVLLSVLPIFVIVLILNLTIAPIGTQLMLRFVVGSVFIIFGLAIFLFGVEIGIQTIGNLMGSTITRKKNIWMLVILGFILGFFINIAEPDLQVLARQVSLVTSGLISQNSFVIVVSIGIGIMVALGLARIVLKIPIHKVFTVLYGLIFLLVIFAPEAFLGFAFDSGGATTGSMSVPFILSLAVGVSSTQAGVASELDSFGLVGIASAGPMIAVLTMALLSNIQTLTGSLPQPLHYEGIILPFLKQIPLLIFEVTMSLLPILITFLVFQIIYFKLPKKQLNRILKGLLYTFVGFVLFLAGVNTGFMEAGNAIGYAVASIENNWIIIPIGFVIGLTVILAEPAVYVLNEQIRNVTSGHIRKKSILFALSIGVGIAVGLSMVRILSPHIRLWHFLIPGYIIAIALSYFAPTLFVGIAFDSGGVASGPMTATFILAFAQGVAEAVEGADVLLDAFGVIAMVALTPLIAIQVLGLMYERKVSKKELS